MSRLPRIVVAGLLLTWPAAPAAAQPLVACSAARPSVALGEAVGLVAWAAAGARYAWEAPVGRLEGRGAGARWDLDGLPPGSYAATVTVSEAGGRAAPCVVRVLVRRDPGGRGPGPRETGAALLVAGGREADGYGLYSYVLLGAPPMGASRERYLKALEAYWTLLPDVVGLEQYVPRGELNVAYAPVRAAPSGAVSAAWLLENYDFVRARSLLRHLPGETRDGPYIVSALRPLGIEGRAAVADGKYLFQDLSAIPPRLVESWVKEFLSQAAQERFWDERAGASFALRLRLTVGLLAEGLPEVKRALDTWIAWVR